MHGTTIKRWCCIKDLQSGVYWDVPWSECTRVKIRYSSYSYLSNPRTKFSKTVEVTVEATRDAGTVPRVMKWIIVFNSSVGTATGYGLDCSGIESRWWRASPHLSRPALKSTQSLYNEYRVFPGFKAAWAWRWPPIQSSAEVKGSIQPYLYSTSGTSWTVLGWPLPLPLLLP